MDKETSIFKLRDEYLSSSLNESDVLLNPIAQFNAWLNQALASQVNIPNAFTLSTATKTGIPSARILLLREATNQGFSFFTNYHSRKGTELQENERACISFFWPELERQVIIDGKVEKLSDHESDEYFFSRPRGSKIGAWASPQSKVLKGREELDHFVDLFNAKYTSEQVPRPENWGGFRLIPYSIEFWQGRRSRLHDRICYKFVEGNWQIVRLAP